MNLRVPDPRDFRYTLRSPACARPWEHPHACRSPAPVPYDVATFPAVFGQRQKLVQSQSRDALAREVLSLSDVAGTLPLLLIRSWCCMLTKCRAQQVVPEAWFPFFL
jgi:hypothetical protein